MFEDQGADINNFIERGTKIINLKKKGKIIKIVVTLSEIVGKLSLLFQQLMQVRVLPSALGDMKDELLHWNLFQDMIILIAHTVCRTTGQRV